MQAVKDKLNEMSAMRKAKASAKAEEQAEKEMAKARVDIAHEVRLAREAEAKMELHVAKAEEKVDKEIAKHVAHAAASQPQDQNDANYIVHEYAATTTPFTAGPGPNAHPANQYL